MANHASHGALPYPIKGARFTVLVPLLDADGDPTAQTTPDTEISEDNGAATDAAEEVSATSGMDGMGMITFSGAETDCSLLAANFKAASGPKATLMTLQPRVLAVVGSGTLSAGSAGGGTLGTLLAYDVTGCFIKTTGGTGGGGTGGANNQARKIITYNVSTGAFTVAPNWETTPSTDTTYDVLLPEGVTLGMLKALNPTTPGRTATVDSAGGILLSVGTGTGQVSLASGIMDANIVQADSETFNSNAAANLINFFDNAATSSTYTLGDLEDLDALTVGANGFAAIKADTAATLVDTGTTLQAELDAIQSDVEDIQGRLPAALTGDGNIKADMLYISGTAQTPLDLGAFIRGLVLKSGIIGDTGNSTTAIHLNNLPFGDDELNNYLLVIYDVSADEFHSRWIEDWTATGDIATVETLPFTPQDLIDTYWILPVRKDVTTGAGLDAAGVRAAVGLASANLDTQLSDIEGKVDDVETRLGTPSDLGSGATLAGNLVDIEGQTDDIGVAGAGLTAVPWNAAWDAEVQSEVADALAAYDPPTKAELDAAVANVSVDQIQASALADLFQTDSGTTYGAAVAGSVVKEIADNAGGVSAADIADAVWEEALADHEGTAGSTAEALADAGGSGASAADIADAVLDEALAGHATAGSLGKAISDTLADTNELQTDWANGGRLDLILDARASQSSVDTISNVIGAAGAGLTEAGGTGDHLTAIPWNAAWDAEVQSEVDDALVSQRLDELLNADSDIDGAAPPTVGSVFHELMSKTAGSFTYDQTTDSNEAIRDRGDSAWITATGFSTLDAAGVRTAVGLASANLDTQIADIEGKVDDLETRVGTPSDLGSGATVAANLVDIEGQTGEIGAAGAGLTAIPAAILDLVDGIETGLTPRNALRIIAASVAGKLSGAATSTVTIRNAVADSANRVVATVDEDGNRTSITYTLP